LWRQLIVVTLARKRRGDFIPFANEVADIDDAPAEIRKFQRGARDR
jgi:hypothetical protein